MSKFPCSRTRNMTSHSMENLTFHSLLRWKVIILQILVTSLIQSLFERLGEYTFWAQEWKGKGVKECTYLGRERGIITLDSHTVWACMATLFRVGRTHFFKLGSERINRITPNKCAPAKRTTSRIVTRFFLSVETTALEGMVYFQGEIFYHNLPVNLLIMYSIFHPLQGHWPPWSPSRVSLAVLQAPSRPSMPCPGLWWRWQCWLGACCFGQSQIEGKVWRIHAWNWRWNAKKQTIWVMHLAGNCLQSQQYSHAHARFCSGSLNSMGTRAIYYHVRN